MLFKEDKVARADAEAIRKGVGFYRWTHDLVEITGKDALEVLQKIYISDISKVAVGRSKYTASLDENGEIIDDVIVMHMADGLYWVSDLYGPRRGSSSTRERLIFTRRSSPTTGICTPCRARTASRR